MPKVTSKVAHGSGAVASEPTLICPITKGWTWSLVGHAIIQMPAGD
jgi:hypothetical protein